MYTAVRTSLPAGAFKVKRCDIAAKLRTCQLFHLPTFDHKNALSLYYGPVTVAGASIPELPVQQRRPKCPQIITIESNTHNNKGTRIDLGADDTKLISKQERVKWQFQQQLLYPGSQASQPEGP